MMEFPGKKTAICESSFITKNSLDAIIYGTKGRINILPNWNEKPSGIEVEMYEGEKTTYPCEWEGRGFQFEMEQ